MSTDKMKLREVRVLMDSGTDTYYGADAKAVHEALLISDTNGKTISHTIWLDDSMEEVNYNLAHIVKISAFYRSE